MVHSLTHPSDPRSTPLFEEVSVCPHCGDPTEEKSVSSGNGWEGFTYCSNGCGCLEGERTHIKYECQICKELRDTDECPCQENAHQYDKYEDYER